MTSDIKSEIARRLDLAPDDVAPVLNAALERIRQQVAHYGYARLSGLGTFRQRDEGLAFEPDPSLSETINARFTGLHDLVLEPADAPAENASPPDENGAPPWIGTDEPGAPEAAFERTAPEEPADRPVDEGTRSPEAESPLDEGIYVPEPEADPSFDQGSAKPDSERDGPDAEGAFGPREADESLGESTYVPGADAGDSTYEESSAPVSEDDRVDEEEAGTFWNDLEGPAEAHPLGPESEPPYEDAEFSVLGERDRDAEDASAEAPTVSWAPLGSAERAPEHGDRDETGIPSDDKDAAADGHAPYGEGDSEEEAWAESMEHDEARPRSERLKAPDRTAEPHGLRSDGPVRTIHTPSRRSMDRRDPKPIWFGVGIIVLVAAAAVAYFVLPDRTQDPTALETVQETPRETAQEEAVPPPDTSAVAAADTEAVQEAVPPPAPPPTPFATPLRSDEGIDPADGGYTIVVYSDTDQSLAEGEAARYRDQGFRTDLLSSQQDGVTRFRVGVGQFESLEEAALQREDMAGAALPADAWVLGL